MSLDDVANETTLHKLQKLLRQMGNLKKTKADSYNFKVLRAVLKGEIEDLQTQKSKSGEGLESAKTNLLKIKKYVRQELNAMKKKRDFDKFCDAYQLELDADDQSISDSEVDIDEFMDYQKGLSPNIKSPSASSFNFLRNESSMKTNKGESTNSRLSFSDKLSQSGCRSSHIKPNKTGSDIYVNSTTIMQNEDRRLSQKGIARPSSEIYDKSDIIQPYPILSEVEEANSVFDDS